MQRFVIMGVAGCGKTSVGQGLAARGLVRFVDGDDLHPAENIAKMSSGIPLSDEDRAPWLARVGQALAAADGAMAIGCSALKRKYRDQIRAEAGAVGFVHLHAPQAVIATRMDAREGHFMPPALLDSQFRDLEMLAQDEAGIVVDIDQDLAGVIAEAAGFIERNAG
ncbi:Gluconokinase [Candidatus Rhodobacter oscarellae]|uniref:Gluconokinase n=1 Tax=Candidatus Rhodobacter oscarellae TaxID=1675527 RepID=A0A0J9E6V0_9RHOB|nr:gluconokinase [Candidatus Rhodobacter lobularis]KMW58500.1 Gluconokinase [Candidatus Rhodobacter lobularis]